MDFDACSLPATGSVDGAPALGLAMRLANEFGLLNGGGAWLRFVGVFARDTVPPAGIELEPELLPAVVARDREAVEDGARPVRDVVGFVNRELEEEEDAVGPVLIWSKRFFKSLTLVDDEPEGP